jgi:hypothetical protein
VAANPSSCCKYIQNWCLNLQETVQIPDELSELFAKNREGRMLPADRTVMLDECRKRGIPVQSFDFSNVKIEGVSRYDAGEWLLELTRLKAFDLMRVEFGACARFQVGPTFDFFWRKAQLAMIILGPLMKQRFYSDGKMKRSKKVEDLSFMKEMGWLPNIAEAKVKVLNVPYYRIWHNPRNVLDEVRNQLVASGAYPRLAS